jgi:hypothetical protein
LTAAKTAGKADQQYGAIAPAAQIAIECLDHAHQLIGQNGFFPIRRVAVLAPDAAHHFRDMAVGAIERLTALRAVPGDGREPSFDGVD